MKKTAIILLVLLLSCSKEIKKETFSAAPADVKTLEDFFKRSEHDAFMARGVIEKHRIIQHLTHLRKMNGGGRKYYLLEKDNITEMIRSVTKGIYVDYILINRHGTVIYSRSNDDIFGLDVNEGLEHTPLKRCFSARESIYFDDVSPVTPVSSLYSLYVSIPVFVEESFHGILILQVDIRKIHELLGNSTEIISSDGTVRISARNELILTKYEHAGSIDLSSARKAEERYFTGSSGRVYYTPFIFRNISWIILTKEL